VRQFRFGRRSLLQPVRPAGLNPYVTPSRLRPRSDPSLARYRVPSLPSPDHPSGARTHRQRSAALSEVPRGIRPGQSEKSHEDWLTRPKPNLFKLEQIPALSC
jgi:hypothetical protein